MTDCQAGIAAAGDALTTVEVDGTEMIVDAALLDAELPEPDDWLALPGFDEYLLGYKDRSMMVDDAHKLAASSRAATACSSPRSSAAAGSPATWKRTLTRKGVRWSVQPLADVHRGRPSQGRGGSRTVRRLPRAPAHC